MLGVPLSMLVVQVGIEPTCVPGTEGYSLLPFRSSHCTMEPGASFAAHPVLERAQGIKPCPRTWQARNAIGTPCPLVHDDIIQFSKIPSR